MKFIKLIIALVASPTLAQVPSRGELETLGKALMSGLPAGSQLLAVCGPSEGYSYYVTPKEGKWTEDPISMGRMIVVSSPDGTPNIFFQDATKQFINSREDGAEIFFSFLLPAKNSFGLTETYRATGVTQTYVFSPSPTGELIMLWTTAKSHVGLANVTKVSAYKAICV